MKKRFLSVTFMFVCGLIHGQHGKDLITVPEIDWRSTEISDGVFLRSAIISLFNSSQAIHVIDIDTSADEFEFGVAVADSPLVVSAFAPLVDALAAVNGTFFNMREGYNVHYVVVDNKVVAVTDEKEFGVRATGIFTATGEEVDISLWGPEREDADHLMAEDAIVSGPLLTDDGVDAELPDISFNTARHPRSLVCTTGDGHVLFVVVDGRQSGYADGMSLFELRALARSMGCSDALNLDGGGSSTLYLAGQGSNGVVNKPSGKTERPVPSIIFVRKINKK